MSKIFSKTKILSISQGGTRQRGGLDSVEYGNWFPYYDKYSNFRNPKLLSYFNILLSQKIYLIKISGKENKNIRDILRSHCRIIGLLEVWEPRISGTEASSYKHLFYYSPDHK